MRRDRHKGNEKKRHHFVPDTYLSGFANAEGKLRVYRKDEAEKEIWSNPSSTGFRKYYYSQPTKNGGSDNNTLENLFSNYESKWSRFVEDVRGGNPVNDRLDYLITFLSLQMARVPATRELIELSMAEDVKQTIRALDRNAVLPERPPGIADLIDRISVSIDPHQSIHAMPNLIQGFAKLLASLGFVIIRNETITSFITSDNPVIWFDPTVHESEMKPHSVGMKGDVLLFFPVAKDLALLASNISKPYFNKHGLYEGKKATESFADTMNDLVAKFSYEAFYSNNSTHLELLNKYAEISPTVQFTHTANTGGSTKIAQRVFGARKSPNKWNVK